RHWSAARELAPEARAACGWLLDHGVPVGHQAVLLRGVTSWVRSLRALLRACLRARVKPYYLFQGDTVTGTDHLRVPVDKAIELYAGLRGWLTGMAMPHMVIDAPGGGGKLPFGPTYLESIADDHVVVRTYRGARAVYPQPGAGDVWVPYDEVFFAGVPADDDREGSAEAGLA